MSSVLRIDVVPVRHSIIVAVALSAFLLLAILIGATGPDVYDRETYSAYQCPDQSRQWGPACTGVQMNKNRTHWEREFPKLGLLNRIWTLEVFPYNLQTTPVATTDLVVQVTLLGKNENDKQWTILAINDTHSEAVTCPQSSAQCSGFLLLFEEFIKYTMYKVDITFPNTPETSFIGDVDFVLIYGHSKFSSLDIGFRITYLLIGVGIFAYFLYIMMQVPFEEWAWEQRAITLLQIGIICFNDPLYPFTFAVRGWFFPFVSSLLEVSFFCIILLFWLLMIDKLRRDELRVEFSLFHVPKLIVVGVFGILCLILFAWISIRDQTDPVFGTAVTGIQVLFFMVAILWTGMVAWIIILVAMTIPVVTKKPYLLTRFVFFASPTALCIFSVLIVLLTGTFGSLRETSLSFLYFLTLFNLYVIVLTWGYWPVRGGFTDRNPSEATRLTFQEKL